MKPLFNAVKVVIKWGTLIIVLVETLQIFVDKYNEKFPDAVPLKLSDDSFKI